MSAAQDPARTVAAILAACGRRDDTNAGNGPSWVLCSEIRYIVEVAGRVPMETE